jgi:hypothetical protein
MNSISWLFFHRHIAGMNFAKNILSRYKLSVAWRVRTSRSGLKAAPGKESLCRVNFS